MINASMINACVILTVMVNTYCVCTVSKLELLVRHNIRKPLAAAYNLGIHTYVRGTCTLIREVNTIPKGLKVA